jgi:hypothetical protein
MVTDCAVASDRHLAQSFGGLKFLLNALGEVFASVLRALPPACPPASPPPAKTRRVFNTVALFHFLYYVHD